MITSKFVHLVKVSLLVLTLTFAAIARGGTPSTDGTDQPLMWDSVRPTESKVWTPALKQIIEQYGVHLLRGTSDMSKICPRFNSLSVPQKVHFWAFFVTALTKYESYYNPVVRYVEVAQGTDAVTGAPVASEGLLQLSYQDVLRHPYCNEFDWQADKNLGQKDPKKTIFDPIKNLRCGVRVLNTQVEKYDKIFVDQGAYWAVIKPSHKHSKVPLIVGHLKSVGFCH